MNFETYIAELLQDHDCVIIPDFGGFIANYAPAKINKVNHRFDPPYRKISFNKLLLHNDGLLASYISRKESERYEKSVLRLKEYVIYLKNELRDHQKVNFDRIGILFKNSDGTYRFEQVKDTSFFPEGFGLESFFAKKQHIVQPEVRETLKEKVEPKIEIEKPEPKVIALKVENEPIRTEVEHGSTKRYWPVAAGLLLPMLGYIGWLSFGTPLISDRGQFNYSDLNPFTKHTENTYRPRSKNFEIETTNIEPLNPKGQYLEIANEHQPDKTLVVKLVDLVKIEANASLRYHIIGGCFGVKENADNFVSSFMERGNNSSIVDQKGELYRVSIASFATKKEALHALASYQNEIPNAWLLHK